MKIKLPKVRASYQYVESLFMEEFIDAVKKNRPESPSNLKFQAFSLDQFYSSVRKNYERKKNNGFKDFYVSLQYLNWKNKNRCKVLKNPRLMCLTIFNTNIYIKRESEITVREPKNRRILYQKRLAMAKQRL